MSGPFERAGHSFVSVSYLYWCQLLVLDIAIEGRRAENRPDDVSGAVECDTDGGEPREPNDHRVP